MTNWRDRFRSILDGKFLGRDGPARASIHHDHKACFFATDQDLLGTILDGLAEEPSTAFVKVSTSPRDGVYLGRLFADRPEGVLEVWARFKAHPRLHCCVQDDALAGPWRSRIVRHGSS